jgi:hypothetical protein
MKAQMFVLTLVGCAIMTQIPSEGKTWTLDQRQAQQMKDINAGQKSGQLTVKQSEKLRRDLAQVARKKKKMKSKENGKLTAEDTQALHSKLNQVSTDISNTKHSGRPAR